MAIFTPAEAEALAASAKAQLRAPWVAAGVSWLGGRDRPTVMIKLSLDPKDAWVNDILHNSRYAMFSIMSDGEVKQFASGIGRPHFRQRRAKSFAQALDAINAYLASAAARPNPRRRTNPAAGPAQLRRDGKVVSTHPSVNAALKALHDRAPYSWSHAFKHEGWTITQGGRVVEPHRANPAGPRAKNPLTKAETARVRDYEKEVRYEMIAHGGVPRTSRNYAYLKGQAHAYKHVRHRFGRKGARRGNPGLVDAIRPGDLVTIVNRFGQQRRGRAVMRSDPRYGPGWVLNMGGAHGTPGLANAENIVKVQASKARHGGGSVPPQPRQNPTRVPANAAPRIKRWILGKAAKSARHQALDGQTYLVLMHPDGSRAWVMSEAEHRAPRSTTTGWVVVSRHQPRKGVVRQNPLTRREVVQGHDVIDRHAAAERRAKTPQTQGFHRGYAGGTHDAITRWGGRGTHPERQNPLTRREVVQGHDVIDRHAAAERRAKTPQTQGWHRGYAGGTHDAITRWGGRGAHPERRQNPGRRMRRIPEAQRAGAVARYRAAYPDAATMTDAEILTECVRGDLRCPHCGRWDCGVTCEPRGNPGRRTRKAYGECRPCGHPWGSRRHRSLLECPLCARTQRIAYSKRENPGRAPVVSTALKAGGIRVVWLPANQAWLVMWKNQRLRGPIPHAEVVEYLHDLERGRVNPRKGRRNPLSKREMLQAMDWIGHRQRDVSSARNDRDAHYLQGRVDGMADVAHAFRPYAGPLDPRGPRARRGNPLTRAETQTVRRKWVPQRLQAAARYERRGMTAAADRELGTARGMHHVAAAFGSPKRGRRLAGRAYPMPKYPQTTRGNPKRRGRRTVRRNPRRTPVRPRGGTTRLERIRVRLTPKGPHLTLSWPVGAFPTRSAAASAAGRELKRALGRTRLRAIAAGTLTCTRGDFRLEGRGKHGRWQFALQRRRR